MVVPPDDMRDLHVDVVDDDGQVVCRLTVRPQDHEVLDVGVVERDRPVNEILERRLPGRNFEAHRAGRPRREPLFDFFRSQCAAGAIVNPSSTRRFSGLPLLLQRLGRAEAVVRKIAGNEIRRGLAVLVQPFGLEIGGMWSANVRPFVPVEPQPSKTVDDAGHHVPGGARGVGVFDAEDEDPPVPTRVKPVEQRRPRAADVKISGGRRRESDPNHPLILVNS